MIHAIIRRKNDLTGRKSVLKTTLNLYKNNATQNLNNRFKFSLCNMLSTQLIRDEAGALKYTFISSKYKTFQIKVVQFNSIQFLVLITSINYLLSTLYICIHIVVKDVPSLVAC